MQFFTTVKLSVNRSLTPEGFVLFEGVSIARIGEQIYGPGETEITPGPDGLVRIQRTPEEVFRPETLASCNGKPLVIDHPNEDVTPANWDGLANGVMFAARRGIGDQEDETVADIMIYTPEAIEAIDSGKREVSLGYDADYVPTGDGRGEQRNIVVNHVALVEEGRCGSRCAIRDHKPKGACSMQTRTANLRPIDRFIAASNARHGIGQVVTRDGAPVSSYVAFERSISPNADPGDPDASTPVEDAEELATIERIAALCQGLTKEQRSTLATHLLGDAAAELTPMESFKRSSDRRHGIKDRSLAGNVPAYRLATMSPMQKFVASSNARHGIGR